jgi:hypothetical protein
LLRFFRLIFSYLVYAFFLPDSPGEVTVVIVTAALVVVAGVGALRTVDV